VIPLGTPENKFDLVNRVRLRANQLGDGVRPMIPVRKSDSLISVAIVEVEHDLIPFVRPNAKAPTVP
jgi:DNA-directed RNA polymerase subunit K/omega